MIKSSNAFTVTAHTGCENTVDNTVESIRKALDTGADIFEIDVHFNKDGYPVLSHDTPVRPKPILDEAFAVMAENKTVYCNLDIKSTKNLKAVLLCAEKYGVLDRVFYTGITEDFVASARSETPQIPYYLNMDIIRPKKQSVEYLCDLIDTVRNSGAIGINCNFKNVTEELITAFHENDLSVSVWTVDNKRDMLRMINMKPDNITTRFPSLLKTFCR